MEKTFLYIDRQQINDKIAPAKTLISELKIFYERYKSLNLKELNTDDLDEFFKTPKTFFLNVLTGGESLSVGQLKLDTEKVYDLSPRPEGVDDLVNDITKKVNDYGIQRNYIGNLPYLSILNNELIVNPEYINEWTEMFTYYTTTEDQHNALILLTKIAKDLTELKALLKQPIYGDGTFVENILRGGFDTPFTPKLETILSF